jgi:hypothetical protein
MVGPSCGLCNIRILLVLSILILITRKGTGCKRFGFAVGMMLASQCANVCACKQDGKELIAATIIDERNDNRWSESGLEGVLSKSRFLIPTSRRVGTRNDTLDAVESPKDLSC